MSAGARRIVLTGATKGCGLALARRLAADGHRVAGCGRDANAAAALAAELGTDHDVSVVDVVDRASVAAWAARVEEHFGTPDLVINNAGVIHPRVPFWEVSAEDFDTVIEVNIKGVANVTRAFLPGMLEAGRGVVVNFSSGWGRMTDAGVSGYCASKFAIEGMTQALAQELPAGMAAVPLSPGVIHTGMLETAFGRDQASQSWTPEEWAEAAAPYILGLGPDDNGESLRVPGS